MSPIPNLSSTLRLGEVCTSLARNWSHARRDDIWRDISSTARPGGLLRCHHQRLLQANQRAFLVSPHCIAGDFVCDLLLCTRIGTCTKGSPHGLVAVIPTYVPLFIYTMDTLYDERLLILDRDYCHVHYLLVKAEFELKRCIEEVHTCLRCPYTYLPAGDVVTECQLALILESPVLSTLPVPEFQGIHLYGRLRAEVLSLWALEPMLFIWRAHQECKVFDSSIHPLSF